MSCKIPLAVIFSLLLAAAADAEIPPQQWYVQITGVLSWQDEGLAAYSPDGRKDAELAALLQRRGTPAANISLLLDEAATLKNITAELKRVVRQAPPGATLLVYYAGHGLRRGRDVYFANYDLDPAAAETTGLAVSRIGEIIAADFKGARVLLLADCCYSGALAEVAAGLARQGIPAAAFTSASASNTSTGNWTFSSAIVGCFAGNPLADTNADRSLSLAETGAEVMAAMKYLENQRAGFALFQLPGSFPLARTAGTPPPALPRQEFKPGAYVIASHNGKQQPARLLAYQNGQAVCEFTGYSSVEAVSLDPARLSPPVFPTYPAGTAVKILWNDELYDGKILKIDDGFHLVTYAGYDSWWDEWVPADRLVTDQQELVKVEWEGEWYPACILKAEGDRYFIHYLDYDSSWDEWVTAERLRQE